ncbi:MAG TPA: carboxypeptidase regulatory-like domain-containing protein, partial [Chitinophaga sp.]
MNKIALIICCVLYAAVSFGQSQIKGKLVDKDSKEAMPAAAVALLRSADSSVVQTAVTDNNGNFVMNGMGNGSFRVFVTFLGYKPMYRSVQITATNPQVDLGTVTLSRKGLSLNEVEIVQEKPPVVVKTDTLEFNAGSFKTRENAVVEDLVKKLPGVQVDKDGTITAQGQQVTRILVDGKPFFGTDPKLATKNLPADIVDKVQIIDRKSDQAQFTGIDDGNIEKAINIVLKPEKRKGYFGRATAGYGTDDHFMGSLTANR